jgi:VanZ family protein
MSIARQESLQRLLRIAWIAGIIVVIVGTLLPGDSLPIRELATLDINDKLQHFSAYAALALLPAIHERRRFVVVTALALVAMGVLLEFGQLLSVGRDFEIGDMVADTLGVCAGVGCGCALRGWYRRVAER